MGEVILLTGGTGILGNNLQKHLTNYFSPSRPQFDLIASEWFSLNKVYPWAVKEAKLIVHCAAFTDLVRAEKEKQLCYDTNVLGTRNLASLGIPMLYISTEYVFDGEKGNYNESDYPNPLNFYAETKLLGEYEARRAPQSVVIRCLFKPRPFRHEFACTDQFTSGDYVERVAEEIAFACKVFDRLPPTIHIGFGRRSTFELARESRPGVKPISIGDIKSVRLPQDVSLSTQLWERIKRENQLCGNGL